MQAVKLKAIGLFLFLLSIYEGKAQQTDTVVVKVEKSDSNNKNTTYTINIYNFSKSVICILHSTDLFLIHGTPPQALETKDEGNNKESFNLGYSAADSLILWEGRKDAFSAEPILPTQVLSFQISVQSSRKEKTLNFEYVLLPDFCYNDFKESKAKNITEWYKNYRKIPVIEKLPN